MSYPNGSTGQNAGNEVDDWMFGSGARTGRSLSFLTVGTTHRWSAVLDKRREQKRDDNGNPKFWDPKPGQAQGDPVEQVVLTVQTAYRDPAIEGDDGVRYLYLEGSFSPESQSKMGAMIGAVRATGGKAIEIGSSGSMTYVGDGQKKPGAGPLKNAPKLYSATYVPAVDAAMFGGDSQGQHGSGQNGSGQQQVSQNGSGHAAAAPAAAPAAAASAAAAQNPNTDGNLTFDVLEFDYLDNDELAKVQGLVTGGILTVDAARAAWPPPAGWVPPAQRPAQNGANGAQNGNGGAPAGAGDVLAQVLMAMPGLSVTDVEKVKKLADSGLQKDTILLALGR